jgi:protoheme IX farnesyltransferase
LRYSILLIPVCVGLSYYGITEPVFIPTSLAVNAWVCYEAVRFWRYEGYKGSARGLFWASVWHLPIVLVLAMVLKKGLWERTTRALGFGEEEEWEEEEL